MQEPKISIGACAGADELNVIAVTRKIATPLTDVEIEGLLAALRLKHPLVNDFTPPSPSTTTDPSEEITQIEYVAPAENDITHYRDVLYPQWIEGCRKILKGFHEGRDEIEPPVVLRWPMTNDGTRPGLQVRIEFEAKGPVTLRRLPVDREDEENEDATADGASKESATASVNRFPPAPKPPSFQKQITRIPPPAKSNATLDLSIVKGAGLLGANYWSLSQLPKLRDAGLLDPFSKQLRSFGALAEAADLMRRQSGIFDALGANTLRGASPSTGVPVTPGPIGH